MAESELFKNPNRFLKPRQAGVTAARGFLASAVKAGIKSSGNLDAALLLSQAPCSAAGAFTRNTVRASSVNWCESICPASEARAVFCNSGNANACTGRRGEKDTRMLADTVARAFGGTARSVLVASTGVIGQFLPVNNITARIPELFCSLSRKRGSDFVSAIMTTDTRKKECAYEIILERGKCLIGGCAKGSGMIHPNLATMLCFITTDAAIDPRRLDSMVKRAVDKTFNNLTVDGDTSTNDMVLVLANGASGVRVASATTDARRFEEGLIAVCATLCKMIAQDGEGATKRVDINVTGAATEQDAKRAAKAVANSNLVKTALFGNDPNWGRIVCAIGYSGAGFSKDRMTVRLCDTEVFRSMRPVGFPLQVLRRKLSGKTVAIDIDLGAGSRSATAYTCDFSYDYVKINAEYHT